MQGEASAFYCRQEAELHTQSISQEWGGKTRDAQIMASVNKVVALFLNKEQYLCSGTMNLNDVWLLVEMDVDLSFRPQSPPSPAAGPACLPIKA